MVTLSANNAELVTALFRSLDPSVIHHLGLNGESISFQYNERYYKVDYNGHVLDITDTANGTVTDAAKDLFKNLRYHLLNLE